MKITINVPDSIAEEIATIFNDHDFTLTDDEIAQFLMDDIKNVYEGYGNLDLADAVYAYCHDVKKPTETAL